MRASSQHLLGLVNDVLDFAKIEAGQMGFVRERALLQQAVGDAVAMVLPQASSRGIQVDEEPCAAGAAYLGDPDRVRQVLLNLLSNAVKFTRPGGRVVVRCAEVSEPHAGVHPAGQGPWASIEVEDTGIGISPEHLARVFEPFTQVDDTHTREAGGTGLGLAISRRFARVMGGELSVRSTPGQGSVFTLWLSSAAQAGGPAPAEPGWPAAPGQVQGLGDAGRLLEEEAERVVQAWVERLWVDPAIPTAHGMERALVEDHSLTFLTEIGRALVMLDATGGEPALMRDGDSIQRTIASLHGGQRARLGFGAQEIAREYVVLGEEVEAFLRREVLDARQIDAAPVAALIRRLMERAARIAIEAHAALPGTERILAETQRVIDRTHEAVRQARESMRDGG